MNDLIKVNSENQNQAIDRCQQILQDRREALANKAHEFILGTLILCSCETELMHTLCLAENSSISPVSYTHLVIM